MVGAAGPRVGGAHVAVNMKYDPKSLDTVGNRIAQKFAQIGKRNGSVYRELGASAVTAWRSLLGSVLSGAPLMGGAISLVLVHVVNRQSFHWSIDLAVPATQLAAFAAALILAATVTNVVSARAALGTSALRAVREDW